MAALVRRASPNNDFQALTITFPSWRQVDQWVRNHFRYQTEPYEILYTPELNLHLINTQGYFVGDCDDAATFEATIFRAFGFPTRFVAIRTDIHNPDYQHVFVEALIDGQWLTFDATVRPGIVHRAVERMTYEV